MKHTIIRTAGVAGAVAVGLALTGCGSPAAPAEGPVTVKFWGWAPGYADSVEAFNASQDDIVVEYEEITPGSRGGYEKMQNAVKAGNAPCLGQVGYETLTSFVAQGALEDVSTYAAASAEEFTPASWNSVMVGDAVYGAPVDTGPMALFYNKEVFDTLGIAVPTTWDEYKKAGEAIKAADPSKYLTVAYGNYDYAGFDWQAQAPWFAIDGDSWDVTFDSPEGRKVGDYWEGLAQEGLISPAPMWDQAWYDQLSDGTIATHVGAAWIAGVLKGSAADGAGKWAVAPMPTWSTDDTRVGNVGGSATAVLAGCDQPEAAWTFAHWMSTDPDSYANLVEKAGLYPAATALLDLPALSEPDEYFGGQAIYDVFKEASPNVATGWTWGPNMPETVGTLDEQLGKAWTGEIGFGEALSATQQKTVDAMEAAGISVSE